MTRPLQVLVVDDDVDSADSLATLLEIEGHQVVALYDGMGVLESCSQTRPDVVLLDVAMPGINGYQAASLIRQNATLARTIMVALTGWSTEAHMLASAEAGFDAHLTKPLRLAALREVFARFPSLSADASRAADSEHLAS